MVVSSITIKRPKITTVITCHLYACSVRRLDGAICALICPVPSISSYLLLKLDPRETSFSFLQQLEHMALQVLFKACRKPHLFLFWSRVAVMLGERRSFRLLMQVWASQAPPLKEHERLLELPG